MPRVIKQKRQPGTFDEEKLRAGFLRALEKRLVSVERIEAVINHIKHDLRATVSARSVPRAGRTGDGPARELTRWPASVSPRFIAASRILLNFATPSSGSSRAAGVLPGSERRRP